jgi:hypothetical protein
MARSIDLIKSELTFGGARPSLFEVVLQPPVVGAAVTMNPKMKFMAKAASLPPETQGVIEVPYQGRKIKVAGNRTFPTWDLTIINDEDFRVRNAFESWHQAMNLHRENVRGNGASSRPSSYKGEAEVRQLSKEGRILRTYIFEGVFPVEVSAITLDWGTVDTIEEFTVSLAYDIWVLGSAVEP